VEAILRDQATVISVSAHIDDYYGIKDVYLSLPSVVDAGGIERTIRLDLNEGEIAGLQRSATVLKETIGTIKF
jgi:L-lactate dehydrogenase